MTWSVGIVLFVSLIVFMALELPIALALGLAGMMSVAVFSLAPFELFPQLLFATVDSFTLLAIPFFTAAGLVLGRTTLAKRLVDLAQSLVGSIPGGLGVCVVLAGIFFAGLSGSGPANVAAIALILVPAMVQSGYSREFAAALTASSGGLGIIIPPSIALIIYGSVAEVSITNLFLAGVLPGLVVGAAFIATVLVIAIRRGYRPNAGKTRMPLAIAFRRAIWGLLAPVIILGGIYGGVFTPTEAAAVVVMYSLAVDILIYRSLTWDGLVSIASEAAITASVILTIVACAGLFAWVLNTQGVATAAASGLLSLTREPWLLLLIINGVLLVAGMFLDAISICYILLPIVLPVIRTVGVDPVHFGIIVTANLAVGQITPPVGVNLIAASGVTDVPVRSIAVAALPFIAAAIIALMVITYAPDLSLFLVRLARS